MEWNVSWDGPGHLPHAIKRIKEHYDVKMSVADLRMIKGKIVRYQGRPEEKVRPLMQFGPDVSLWLVKFKNHWYPAVWHERFKEIMTFLPRDAYELRPPHESNRRA